MQKETLNLQMNQNPQYKLNTQYSKDRHELLTAKLKAYNEQHISAYQRQDFLLKIGRAHV